MRIIVLGSAAGGGFPQWNCNGPNSRRARAGDPLAKPRTQSSLAVSADGERWVLLNCSPDLRQQILATPALWPRHGLRSSPIAGAVLTSAEVDHVAGLLTLRERQKLTLWATTRVLDVLAANSIFNALDPAYVDRRAVDLRVPIALDTADGPSGVTIETFAVPGKVALFLEGAAGSDLAGAAEDTVGLAVHADERSFFYVPGCARMTPELADRLYGAALVFFDGTLWQDDEMIAQGLGTKTGQRMGHMSVSGPGGSMAAFASVDVRRKVYIHINNTNPILIDDSPERASVAAAGWEVAEDGMEIVL